MSNDIIQLINDCPMVKNIPTGISHLLKELIKQDSDVDELIGLLERFPVVCVRLVMVANSAWAAPKVEITNVKRACLQLGLKMVKSISIALLVSQQFNSQNCKGFDEKVFWLSSLVMADIMQELQKKSSSPETEPSSAHLIGLIHNLGLLAIAEIAPEKMSQALLLSTNTDLSFSAALYKTIDLSFLEATHLILSNWGLPNNLSHAFYGDDNLSLYSQLFTEAMDIKHQLNLNSQPLSLMDDQDSMPILDTIIERSLTYEELCGLYCR